MRSVPARRGAQAERLALRPFAAVPPRVLLIGASTGGPQAIGTLLASLDAVVRRAPVLITQHMPPTFTTIFAEHLERASGHRTREACAGEPIVPGAIFLAPGGRHMRVQRTDMPRIVLDDAAPVNFCRPAVDPLFSSAAQAWGGGTLAVILTGMGHDGSKGAAEIARAGGSIIAQDEATSVVWGMPGAVAQAGLCSAVLPLQDIAPVLARLFAGERP